MAELAQVALEQRHQRVLGVLAERRAISARVSVFSSAIVHGPWWRSPFSTVRKPDSPAGLCSVGNQPLPKLIAFSCS